jgi:hypothetical protein
MFRPQFVWPSPWSFLRGTYYKCAWKYVNLLHYNLCKPTTCFGHILCGHRHGVFLRGTYYKCAWKYVNLLHYNLCKPTTCFGHILCGHRHGVFYEGHITSAQGNMWIYYIIIFVNRLHVSATICVAIAMEFFTRDILQWQPNQCKGKTVPLQAYSDSEDSRKLRFPDYMITVYDGKVSLTHRPPLPPGNAPGTHFC